MKLLQFHFISHPHGRHFVCSIFLRWLTLVFPLNHLHVSSSHYIVPRLMEECHSFDAATFTMCRVPNLDYVVFLWCSAPQHIDHCLIGPLYYLRHYFPINLSDRVSSMLLHFFIFFYFFTSDIFFLSNFATVILNASPSPLQVSMFEIQLNNAYCVCSYFGTLALL